jgi:hypothetical protein
MSLDNHVKMVQIKKQDERQRLIGECRQLIKSYDLDRIAKDIMMNKHHIFSGFPNNEYFTTYEICEIMKDQLEIAFHDPNYIFRIVHVGYSYNVYVFKNTFLNRFFSSKFSFCFN